MFHFSSPCKLDSTFGTGNLQKQIRFADGKLLVTEVTDSLWSAGRVMNYHVCASCFAIGSLPSLSANAAVSLAAIRWRHARESSRPAFLKLSASIWRWWSQGTTSLEREQRLLFVVVVLGLLVRHMTHPFFLSLSPRPFFGCYFKLCCKLNPRIKKKRKDIEHCQTALHRRRRTSRTLHNFYEL